MEDDREQQPASLLPYEEWTDDALRMVVAKAVEHASVHGLPGDHHFYVTFLTEHAGVQMPARMKAQYPKEMTIVLQHQFWDLTFDRESETIGVGLSFGGVPTTLRIPLRAVVAFADPHIRYGLRFRPPTDPAPVLVRDAATDAAATPAADTPEPASEAPQVVSLDAFRRRPPPKH